MSRDGFLREIQLHRERVDSFEDYPFSIPAIRQLDTLELGSQATIFVGENGSGKSTLIEAVAVCAGMNPEGGTRHFRFAKRKTESELHRALGLVRNPGREQSSFFFRAETMFNLATEVERLGLGEYGWEDMHARSHGESFLWIVQHRLGPDGLYLFDEPESALSPSRQLSMLRLMHDLVRAGSQLLIATHSPILMAYPGATIYSLGTDGISRINYEESEHYAVMRSFLTYPDRMLQELLAD